jgi:protein SCO1
MIRRLSSVWLATALVALTGAACSDKHTVIPEDVRAVMIATPVKLEPVRLSDHNGQPVTEAWFTGQWSFVFLGFTHCPDVCPATLAQLGVIKKSLAQQFPDAPKPRYVFVSVDPQRDTPARLAAYVAGFDRSFIGVSGDAAQIKALENALAAFHRQDAPSTAGDYRVMHSGEIYLLDPVGRVYAKFQPPMDPALVARQLISMMAFYAKAPGAT